MNENLTIDEYIQTKPNHVKDLIVTSLMVLDTFTNLTYGGKSFKKIISYFSLLDKDVRQDKSYLFSKDSPYGVSKTIQRLHIQHVAD
ncbi:hypothetical protein EMGBD3_17390 [Nitrosarchaeum sp.]|nr:hypothetical protein EMGBD3_17390 [Nitrosarchaeum sp.]